MLKTKRIVSFALTLVMLITMVSFVATANAATVDTNVAEADASAEASSASTITSPSDFSWDNANVYFLLTDRFYNGNTSNDHSYGRSLNQSGQVTNGNSDAAAFHGGDFAGITKKINEGYFDNLGVNALWISAPYEQIHGYCIAGNGKSGSFPHYSYHGYYALDFSETDANFGTAEEFETMVDTAHEHGIRIVLDVVMNHVGYNTLQDMSEYGFGTLKSGWETGYYNATLTDVTYHQYIDYNNNASDWAKWWGSSWLRAGLAGYSEGSGDLQGGVSYLPDVKTESTATVNIPEVLKTKWTKEGILASKQAELNNYFSSTGKSQTVRNYMVFWLSQWVEKYGVDGFRCDTAKHVELESWKALKDQCLTSLETWRKNNPTKPGADWDEDFWMTGECYTHYLSYDSYYTQGGFDSMINFSFNDQNSFNASASGVPGVSSINSTYANYASQLNTNDKYNVLSYLSSHDTRLCRSDMIYQGSAFQLLPGAIQIYYGDETNRPLATGLASGNDHALRADMNWSSIDTALLQHWQKVGTFRNNHVAVGAGSHTTLSATSGAAFARTYNKNGVYDVVAACIGATANTNVTITLNSTFADGTVLKNTYDGTTATVSGGKVTFNSGANGTILLESTGGTGPIETDPTTPVTEPTTSSPLEPTEALVGDVNLDGKINIIDCAYVQLSTAKLTTLTDNQTKVADVNKDGSVNIKDAAYIQCYIAEMGVTGSYVGTKIEIEVPVTTAPVTEPTTQPTTQPTTAPTDPVGGTVVYFKNTNNWSTVNIHYWNNSGDTTDWPGVAMTLVSGDVYTYTVPAGMTGIVFNGGGDYAKTGDLSVPSQSGMIYSPSTNSWTTYSGGSDPTTPATTAPTDPVDGTVVYFKNTNNWSDVRIHYWSNSDGTNWPGMSMNLVSGNVYSYTVPSGMTGIVFNGSGGSVQTGDLTVPSQSGMIYDPSTNSWSSYN